jgi:hypothetical protein
MGTLDIDAMTELRTHYLDAAKAAGAQIATSSGLKKGHFTAVQKQLTETSNRLAEAIEKTGMNYIGESAKTFTGISSRFMQDSGVSHRNSIVAMTNAVNTDVVNSTIMRQYGKNNYTFSDSVWNTTRKGWLDDVKSVVTSGIAMGRDPVKIAQDLAKYTRGGKTALLKSWGPEAKMGDKRLPEAIDYRAARLVRSEMYASMQNAQALAGLDNPACNGLFDWILNASRVDWNCICEELAADGPYEYEELPDYPHPNCMCIIQPKLRDHDQFMKDLKAWGDGEDVDYMDEWADNMQSQYVCPGTNPNKWLPDITNNKKFAAEDMMENESLTMSEAEMKERLAYLNKAKVPVKKAGTAEGANAADKEAWKVMKKEILALRKALYHGGTIPASSVVPPKDVPHTPSPTSPPPAPKAEPKVPKGKYEAPKEYAFTKKEDAPDIINQFKKSQFSRYRTSGAFNGDFNSIIKKNKLVKDALFKEIEEFRNNVYTSYSAADTVKEFKRIGQAIVRQAEEYDIDPKILAICYRTTGGDIKIRGSHAGDDLRMFSENAFLPTDWINDSNKVGGFWLTTRMSEGAYYNWRDKQINIPDHSEAPSTALHEFTHRVEAVRPELRLATNEYWNERTKADNKVVDWWDYKVIRDKFKDEYMGRVYDWETRGGTGMELLSRGWDKFMRNMGAGQAVDDDYREWFLGVLTGG